MGKLSKRMKRLLAILLVEVIVASNVFISYADENDNEEPLTYSEEELEEQYGDVNTFMESHSDDDPDDSDDSDEDPTEAPADPTEAPADPTEAPADPTEGPTAEPTEEPTAEPTEKPESDPVVCTCDVKCTTDEYNTECPVCSKAADAEDAETFLNDNCKGQAAEQPKEDPDEKEIEPEIVNVDNSVTVTAICKADGEEIEGAESFEIKVDGTVAVLEKAPEIEGYTFADKATLEDGSEISEIKKETTEEKEETEVDGEMAVTKITTTTSMSYYDGTQWKDLENDIVVVFEYTQAEETDEETATVKFIASFVDQDGNAIEGYTSKTLTFDDTLDLTKEPVVIENYTYVEAQIDDAVVTSINKKTETDEEGEEVVTYSYTVDGEEVEVTENTEVTLVYEGGEEVIAAEVTLTCVDEKELTIEGYEKAELPEFETELILNDPKKAPVEIEGYEYKEAAIDGVVITSLVKEVPEESADAESEEEAAAVYSYVTEAGETVLIEEDTVITLSYEEAEVAVMLDATIVDEFGDEIAEKYTNMDISKIFDKDDELTLDDPETPPVKKVSVRKNLFKNIKYTYVKASVDNEIITGLKRKAMESEDAKASEQGYAYSYTTDGETWEKIKEDTTVIFEYSDGKKTTYTYEDSFVSVTATLQHANAIPDDAEFVVTPVTPSTSGYNYDAYMEALNDNADQIGDSDTESSDKDAKKYTEDNTLLYDIAFLAEPVDEEGNVIEGSKVEYQPADGMVKISFTFKQKQLEDDLNAEKAGDVTVVHMPLTDAVKESVDTTADATEISASDINLEVVSASVSVNAEQVDFSLSNFSLSALCADGIMRINPGTPVSIDSVLGDAVYYGVVANEMKIDGHMETNFATGSLHGGSGVQANNNGGGAGETYIGAYDGNYFKMSLNGNVGSLLIHTTEEAMRNFGFDMTHLNPGDPLENLQFEKGVIVDYTTYSEAEIKKIVSDMVDHVGTVSAELYARGDSQGYDYSEIVDKSNNAWPTIDIAKLSGSTAEEVKTGTYYINFANGEYAKLQEGHFAINIRTGQNVVLNIPDENVSLGAFKLYIDGKEFTSDGYQLKLAENVIFNCPNAIKASTNKTDGTFLFPNADYSIGGTSSGYLVADKISSIGGQEWHSLSKRIPVINPTSFVLKAIKTVNGQPLTAEESGKFKFSLYSIAEDGTETFIEEVTNNGGSVEFTKFDNIKTPGTYWYKIQETGKVDGMDNYRIDTTIYYAEVVVTSMTSGLVTNTDAKVIYHMGSMDSEAIGAATFNNLKEEKGSITVKKAVIGDGAPANAEFFFTLKDAEGNLVEKDGKTIHVIKADESVTFTGLEYGKYTLTETDEDGNAVETSSSFPYQVTAVTQEVTIDEGSKTPEATITNTYYEPTGTWQPNVKKVFNQGNAGMAPEFTFEISGYGYDANNNKATVPGAGETSFAPITYRGLGAVTEPGKEYEYTIKEIKGSDTSITYDGATYVVKVKVSVDPADKNKLKAEVVSVNGEPYSTSTNITFTNTYQAKGGVQLQATKFVDNKTPDEKEVFTFELYKLDSENGTATGKPYKTAVNEGQNITFNLTDEYTQEDIGQTFWYLIKEQALNAESGYVTNEQSFKVSVLVKADPTDSTKLIGEATYHDGEAVFNNTTYKPDSVTVTATKMLENGSIDEFRNKFTFELYQITGTGESRTETLLQSVTNGQNGNSSAGAVEFTPLNYTRADIGKTYTYEIREKVENENYIDYDQHIVTLTVTVTYNEAEGKVVATPKYGEEGKITFKNGYKPTPVSVPLEVGKSTQVPEGVTAKLDQMEFTFVVKDSTGAEVTRGTSKANEQITFAEQLSFDKAGTYTYTIEEVKPKEAVDGVLDGITYDQKIITAVVTVEDNYDGTLKQPTVKYYDKDKNELSTPSFENEYRPGEAEITFSGTKSLTGRDWVDADEFTFGLWVGNKTEGVPADTATATAAHHVFHFDKLTFDKTGTYEYTVKEILPDGADTNVVDGITYDTKEYHVTVTVSDNGSGELQTALSGDLTAENGFNFENKYSASGKFQSAVFKTVNGQKPDPDEKFTFQLYERINGTETPVGEPIENVTFDDAKDIVLFDEITYTAEDSHTYVIKETGNIDGYTNDQTVYTAKVTVADIDHNGTFTVTCQYYAGESMMGSAESGEAAVTVNNTRPSDGEALIEARKDLIGGDLTKNTFTFTLSSTDDTNLASRGATLEQTTNGQGRVSFGMLKYTRADLKGASEHIYTYTITEQDNGEDYIDYDPQPRRTVKVRVYLEGTAIKTEVTYDSVEGDLYANDGNAAVFHNTYKGEGSFSIEGTKTLTGGNVAREFTFDLYEVGGITPVATSTVSVDPDSGAQIFMFEDVPLNEMGDHTYVVKEHIPEGAVYNKENQTAVYQGVTYSTKEYRVTVHMDDAGNGNFVQGETVYLDGPIAFTNDYRTSDTFIDIYGNKILTGRTGKDLQAGEFTFGLYENGALVEQGVLTNPVTNAADGNFSFHIDYTEAGTHYYVVKEIPQGALDGDGKLNNIHYDETAVGAGYSVTVVVADNDEGKLVASITSGLGNVDQPVTITNSYEDEIDVVLSATKKVNGAVPSEEERGRFEFVLTGVEPNQRVTNGAGDGSAAGSITFAPIHYTQDDIGEHEYTVYEVQSRPANSEAGENQETEIYEYSNLIYTVTVNVFVNDNGELDKTITYTRNDTKFDEMTFDNQKHRPAELSFRARKELIGSEAGGGTPTLQENMFQFKLTSTDDDRIPEEGVLVSNNGAGEVSFTTIEYNLNDISKVYHYTIEEIVPDENNRQPGVTYDSNPIRTITVEVGTDENGNVNPVMTCDGTVTDGNIPLFTNKYEAAGSFIPKATKTLTGRDMEANEFQFVLDGEGEHQVVGNAAAANGVPAEISFAPIEYTLKDVRKEPYIYTVSEVRPQAGEAGKPGITYSDVVYTISVTVTDNYDGTLNVVPTYSSNVTGETMTFTNKYDASGAITLSGTKTLTGRDMAENEFKFEVMEGNNLVATGTNTGATNGNAAAITFTEIKYGLTDLGYHTYTISEVTDNLPAGVARNDQSFTVVVNVSDANHNGTLVAQVVEDESQTVAFENTYTASGSIRLEAVKTVNGDTPTGDEVFTFTLTGGYGDKIENQSVTNNGKKVTFAPIIYNQDDVGKPFVYTVQESKDVKKGYHYDPIVYTVVVTVGRDDNAEGGLSVTKVVKIGDTTLTGESINFNNTYPEAGEVQLEAWKDLINGTLTDEMFSFTLTGPKTEPQTKPNVGNKVTFDTIHYDESDVGENYIYTITENNPAKTGVNYDTKLTRTVTVEVREVGGEVVATPKYSSGGKYKEDDDKNMAIFHNTYHASGELELTATKNLTGRNLNAGEFDFVVIETMPDNTQNIVATGTNDADGTINFSEISYNERQTGPHNYVIKELSGKLPDVTFDGTEYQLTVNVTDKHDGTLNVAYTLPTGGFVFNNRYNAKGSITFEGTKALTGRELTADDHFTFEVYEVIDGKESTEAVATGTNDADGKITFTPISYESEKGDVRTHEYHVKEVEGSQPGITYSKTVCTVWVSVTNNQDGTLSAVLTSDSKPITFTNIYESEGKLQLEAWKTVNAKAPNDRVFSFILSNDKDSETDTKSNGADGHVVFDKITFTEEDVKNSPITYTIKEVIPESVEEGLVEGMNYDTSEYTVTVTLTDDGKGNITVSPDPIKYVKDGQESDKALFNNTYEAANQVVIEASKRLEGGTLKDNQFTFILSDENGEIERVKNNGSNVVFTPIDYTLADVGEHVYTIEELPGDAKGYTYDGTKFTVKVTVTDNGPGNLGVTKEYVGLGENQEVPEFVNGYIPKEVEISKVDAVSLNELPGASMAIVGEGGETLDSWVSDGGRHVFKADYDKTYTLTETAAPDGFLIADSITFRIDADGELWIMQADGSFVQQADSVVTMVDEAAPVPTPTPTPTPTPGDEPTPTPGDEPTPTPTTPGDESTPTPTGSITTSTPGGATSTPNDETVLGARRSREAVLGARRGPKKAVLGKRRRPATGDSLALLIWIMVLSLGAGGAVTSSTMLRTKKKDKK